MRNVLIRISRRGLNHVKWHKYYSNRTPAWIFIHLMSDYLRCLIFPVLYKYHLHMRSINYQMTNYERYIIFKNISKFVGHFTTNKHACLHAYYLCCQLNVQRHPSSTMSVTQCFFECFSGNVTTESHVFFFKLPSVTTVTNKK